MEFDVVVEIPGCLISCRAIGMFRIRDENGADDKVLCVAATGALPLRGRLAVGRWASGHRVSHDVRPGLARAVSWPVRPGWPAAKGQPVRQCRWGRRVAWALTKEAGRDVKDDA
jgi:hypothetical protein